MPVLHGLTESECHDVPIYRITKAQPSVRWKNASVVVSMVPYTLYPVQFCYECHHSNFLQVTCLADLSTLCHHLLYCTMIPFIVLPWLVTTKLWLVTDYGPPKIKVTNQKSYYFRVHHACEGYPKRRRSGTVVVKVVRSVSPSSQSWGWEVAGGLPGKNKDHICIFLT